MKKAFVVTGAICGFLTVMALTPVRAQETQAQAPASAPVADVAPQAAAPAAPAAAGDEDKFSFGKVVSVADGVVTVKEYDFAKDADVETAYAVSSTTELGNVNAITDLKAGDDIVIDYVEKDGKRVVTTLVKEEKNLEAAAGEGEAAPKADAAAVAAPAAPAADAAVAPAADKPADAPAQK